MFYCLYVGRYVPHSELRDEYADINATKTGVVKTLETEASKGA